jgi:Lon protease-like protein
MKDDCVVNDEATADQSAGFGISTLPLLLMSKVAVPGEPIALTVQHRWQLGYFEEATRRNCGLAQCLAIEDGRDGWRYSPAASGVELRVESFDSETGGTIRFMMRGVRRFEVLRRHALPNGTDLVDVKWLDPADLPKIPIENKYEVLRIIVDGRMADPELAKLYPEYGIAAECREDAHWVSWRIASILHGQNFERMLRLLRESDPFTRMEMTFRWYARDILGPDSPYGDV